MQALFSCVGLAIMLDGDVNELESKKASSGKRRPGSDLQTHESHPKAGSRRPAL